MAFDYASKVRGLLAKADSAEAMGNLEEMQSYRAAAFRIMRDYQIAEEEALAVDPTSAVPISVVMDFRVNGDSTMSYYLAEALRRICRHTGTRIYIAVYNGAYRATIVGYEGDVRYTEFLWTSAYLMFSTKITPSWDSNRPEAENIFLMRNAGMERRVIADAAWGRGAGDEPKNRSKVQRVYISEAKARGEEVRAAGLGFDTKTYREAYAESFVTHLTRMMRQARDAADSVGGALTLHGREDRVTEAFYELFPGMRPSDAPAVPYVDPRTDCARCQAAASGYCREHGYLKPRAWSAADQRRADARMYGASAQAGRQSGRDAAAGVVIQRGHTTNDSRIERSGNAIES
jgi:hypothetical protein